MYILHVNKHLLCRPEGTRFGSTAACFEKYPVQRQSPAIHETRRIGVRHPDRGLVFDLALYTLQDSGDLFLCHPRSKLTVKPACVQISIDKFDGFDPVEHVFSSPGHVKVGKLGAQRSAQKVEQALRIMRTVEIDEIEIGHDGCIHHGTCYGVPADDGIVTVHLR